MTDFDQIIKEKVEQKEYPYSASSWHSFAKKAGLKSALTLTQSVIIAVVSVTIIAVGSWFGIRHFSVSDEVVPASVEELPAEEPVLAAIDTVAVEEVTEEPVVEEAAPAPSRKPAPKVTNEPPKADITETEVTQKPVKEPILRPKNPRRILEIDPDTIKSNE
jgi:hypothetical protein